MSPAMVFVVPLVVTMVLTGVTGLAYRHARRPYLLWWTGVWGIAVLFYLSYISAALTGPASADVFASFGLLASGLGWLRVVGFWLGARRLMDRRLSRRGWVVLGAVSVAWTALAAGCVVGGPAAGSLTRLSYAGWFFLGAAELLLRRPRTTVTVFCGCVLLLMGIQGIVAAQMVLDLTGSMMSSWIHTALSLALGLGVLGRLLEEQREAAAAWSADLVPDEETRREFLTVIDEETDRLTELVSNLLDMSRIEAGSLRVDPHPTELSRLLEASGARLRAREPARSLALDVPPELPSVLADEQRIAQVLDNLLTNAARYSPAGQQIGLRARAVDGHVEGAVQDHGPGVPEDKREQVFDKFVRLDGSSHPGGSGLGLAICRGIVQAHGGRIWVEPNADQGSTFAFSLPAVRTGH